MKRWVLSRRRKVDNDSAEVTSSGRSFHVRGSTTGKARLVGDGCQLDRRHWQTVGASRCCDVVYRVYVCRKFDIVDSMLQKLEKYADSLESTVEQRTAELIDEKQKTDLLLHRMLPPWVQCFTNCFTKFIGSSLAKKIGTRENIFCYYFYAPQLYRQVLLRRVLAMGILSVCLSVRLPRPGAETTKWDRDTGFSPYDSLEFLVSSEVIWCRWVRRFPSNEGIKEGYPP